MFFHVGLRFHLLLRFLRAHFFRLASAGMSDASMTLSDNAAAIANRPAVRINFSFIQHIGEAMKILVVEDAAKTGAYLV